MLPRRSKAQPVEHHNALPIDELPQFMADLRQRDGVPARAVEFLVLTAARRGEVLNARWSEINEREPMWVIPGARMKNGKEHRIPLSDGAITILQQMKEHRNGGRDLIFPRNSQGEPLTPPTMRRVLELMGYVDRASVHGFRASFSSWAASRTSAPHEVIELSLAHAVGSAVVRAYQRDDLANKRRALMQQWAAFLDTPVDEADRVVAIGGKR
jgi:integrase